MNKRGLGIKLIVSIVIVIVFISAISTLLNKKDKITAKVTSEIQDSIVSNAEDKVEEIYVGEGAKQTNPNEKIKEVPSTNNENNLANNSTKSSESNETFYLQMLNSNMTKNVSTKHNNT